MNPTNATSEPIFQLIDFAVPEISLLSLLVSFATYLYVARQVRLLRSQIQIEAGFKIDAVNRELLTMAFNDAELFSLFEDRPFTAYKQKFYIQMWLNHIDAMWQAHEHQLIKDSEWYAMKKDISDFFSINLVKQHWETVRSFHTPEFVQFVVSISSTGQPKQDSC